MLFTITITITSLVIFNLVLLKFSSNKIIRSKKINEKPVILHPHITFKTEGLAPTGS